MKIKIIILVLGICFFCIPSIAHNSRILDEYSFAKDNFKWVKKKFYYYLDYKCMKKKIDPIFALAIAQTESGGKNVISRKNRNGSRDYGRFQVNSVHMPKRPRKLLNYKINIDKAMYYLGLALKKAKGDLGLACIYYNAGLNCNVGKYRRSKKLMKYPKKILRIYRSLTVSF